MLINHQSHRCYTVLECGVCLEILHMVHIPVPWTESCAHYHHSLHNNNSMPTLTGWLNGPDQRMKPLIYLQVYECACVPVCPCMSYCMCICVHARWMKSQVATTLCAQCLCICSSLLPVRRCRSNVYMRRQEFSNILAAIFNLLSTAVCAVFFCPASLYGSPIIIWLDHPRTVTIFKVKPASTLLIQHIICMHYMSCVLFCFVFWNNQRCCHFVCVWV